MTSIRDVAKLAGVSPSTVSRVINVTFRTTEVFQCQGQISGICGYLQTVWTGSTESGMRI